MLAYSFNDKARASEVGQWEGIEPFASWELSLPSPVLLAT